MYTLQKEDMRRYVFPRESVRFVTIEYDGQEVKQLRPITLGDGRTARLYPRSATGDPKDVAVVYEHFGQYNISTPHYDEQINQIQPSRLHWRP